MTSTWKAVLGIIAIFIFGWLAGALSTSIFMGHRALAIYRGGPAAWAQAVERRLTRNLDLDETQKKQIHQAFLDNVNQRIQLQKQIQPQIQALNAETLKQITAVLRPDQAEKFRSNVDYFRMRAGRNFLGTGSSTPETNSATASPPEK